MLKYIQFYFATLSSCVVFLGLIFFSAFVFYPNPAAQKIPYCLLVFGHLGLQIILLSKWQAIDKLHKLISAFITVTFYVMITVILWFH
jgi:hypothetical protein